MNKTRYKIALLVSSTVMMTLLLILAIFNLMMNHQIEENAKKAIDQTLSYDYEDPSLYYADYIAVYEEDLQDFESMNYYSSRQLEIIQYCIKDPQTAIHIVTLNSRTYYIKHITEKDSEYGEYQVIAYVDVTGEPERISQINFFFLLAAIITALFGSIEGYFIGKKLEENKLSQKQFFENTSHEMKTPLSSIKGYAEGMCSGVITDTKKASRVILSQTEHMSKMIDDILSMAKIESGAMKVQKETISVDESIQDALMPFESIVFNQQLEVSLHLQKGNIQADPDLLQHVLTNLISNSIKYAEHQIQITFDGNKIVIWNDTDSLKAEDIEHIFERFYTGENGNTGIGLALAKDIVELHGWKIRCEPLKNGIQFEIDI